ncbi:hypothetical protein HELRODRAFT_73133, partial [Helobdella robusta]|uniref:Alpha-carbonic anhydrase domain-containing protein n=1 Tax=Helobdella robusta TaxID=6412 RepID=T1G1A6_HELRO
WSEWWTHNGISGPNFWGLVNPEWVLCTRGKRQSPIDINTNLLLFDARLNKVHLDSVQVYSAGKTANNAETKSARKARYNTFKSVKTSDEPLYVNLTGGPLSYQYRVVEVFIHFGSHETVGSEHTIDGIFFPAEIQIVAYNSEIYGNYTQAKSSTYGLAVLSVLCKIGNESNEEFQVLAKELHRVKYRGNQVHVPKLTVKNLLPKTSDIITYEGSLTIPGCDETVTWIIFNKPMLISNKDLLSLRDLVQGDEIDQNVSMENNCRHTNPLNDRPVRTNINFHGAQVQ